MQKVSENQQLKALSPRNGYKSRRIDGHCIQYAAVGYSTVFVYDTEGMTDEEIRKEAGKTKYDEIYRFARCPKCEAWTRTRGKLRTEIDCPAIQELVNKYELPANHKQRLSRNSSKG